MLTPTDRPVGWYRGSECAEGHRFWDGEKWLPLLSKKIAAKNAVTAEPQLPHQPIRDP